MAPKSQLLLIDGPYKIARQSNEQEMRQEKRAYRKAQRELDKAPVEFDYKRNGGIF
jgi:hypothetical protein